MISQTGQLCRSSDAGFDQLLEEVTRRIQNGDFIDVDAFAAEHPEYAARLRRLLPAMQALVAFGNSQSAVPRGPSDLPGAPSSLEAGILGDFRIVREIGRGGMGIVYEAQQISLSRRVAVKVLPFAAVLDDRQLSRFKNEARAAASLHHTNIVPVFSVGCERGVHYYAMQFIDGHTLADVIVELRKKTAVAATSEAGEESRTKDVEQPADTLRASALSTIRCINGPAYCRAIARLSVQAAEALAYAHRHGVLHRDIKPANLMLDAEANLWITDFGLARLEADAGMTMTGDLVGTLRYMSPEQALGKPTEIDHRTDIYSLGVTLYELLALAPPFAATDRAAIVQQINSEDPPSLCRRDRGIPAELETIVLKAMSRSPLDRYASAQELADDLRRFLEDKPIRARRPSLATRARKWARRHPAIVWSAFICVVVAAFAAGASMALVTNVRHEFAGKLSNAEQQVAEISELGRVAEQAKVLAVKAMEICETDAAQAVDLSSQALAMVEPHEQHMQDDTAFQFAVHLCRLAVAESYIEFGNDAVRKQQPQLQADRVQAALVVAMRDEKALESAGSTDQAWFCTKWLVGRARAGAARSRTEPDADAFRLIEQASKDFQTVAECDLETISHPWRDKPLSRMECEQRSLLCLDDLVKWHLRASHWDEVKRVSIVEMQQVCALVGRVGKEIPLVAESQKRRFPAGSTKDDVATFVLSIMTNSLDAAKSLYSPQGRDDAVSHVAQLLQVLHALDDPLLNFSYRLAWAMKLLEIGAESQDAEAAELADRVFGEAIHDLQTAPRRPQEDDFATEIGARLNNQALTTSLAWNGWMNKKPEARKVHAWLVAELKAASAQLTRAQPQFLDTMLRAQMAEPSADDVHDTLRILEDTREKVAGYDVHWRLVFEALRVKANAISGDEPEAVRAFQSAVVLLQATIAGKLDDPVTLRDVIATCDLFVSDAFDPFLTVATNQAKIDDAYRRVLAILNQVVDKSQELQVDPVSNDIDAAWYSMTWERADESVRKRGHELLAGAAKRSEGLRYPRTQIQLLKGVEQYQMGHWSEAIVLLDSSKYLHAFSVTNRSGIPRVAIARLALAESYRRVGDSFHADQWATDAAQFIAAHASKDQFLLRKHRQWREAYDKLGPPTLEPPLVEFGRVLATSERQFAAGCSSLEIEATLKVLERNRTDASLDLKTRLECEIRRVHGYVLLGREKQAIDAFDRAVQVLQSTLQDRAKTREEAVTRLTPCERFGDIVIYPLLSVLTDRDKIDRVHKSMFTLMDAELRSATDLGVQIGRDDYLSIDMAWYWLTWERADESVLARCRELVNSIERERPSDRQTPLLRGILEYRNGNWSAAIERLRQPRHLAMGLSSSPVGLPRAALARLLLAECCLRAGDQNEANKWLVDADAFIATHIAKDQFILAKQRACHTLFDELLGQSGESASRGTKTQHDVPAGLGAP